MQLAEAQPLEGPGLDAERAAAQLGHEDGGAGEDEVAGEDGHGVAPDLVGRGGAAAEGRGVHDVVVVQRGQVRQLNHDGGLHHGGQRGVTQVGAEQGQQGADALAAGFHEVTRRCVSQGVGVGDRFAEFLLHPGQVGGDGRAQVGVFRDGRETCRQLQSGGDGGGVEAGFGVRQAMPGVRPAVVRGVGHGLTLTFCCGNR